MSESGSSVAATGSAKKISSVLSSEIDHEKICFETFESRSWHYQLGANGSKWGIRVNPVTFFASVALIWGFDFLLLLVIWCIVEPDKANAELADVQQWTTTTFTWAYMLSQDLWAIFLVVVYFSKYGNMKLGKPDDKPEYNSATWFMMLFASGIGIGLFYFGVAEPIWHYEPCYPPYGAFAGLAGNCNGNRYARLPDDERAQWAINLTFFHWGIHAWVCYALVALLLAFMSFRMSMPLTMKVAFWPILGDKIWGWMGDAIDTLSVATTLFGVCTSLGLGVQQLNAGFNRLDPSIPVSVNAQIVIIWSVTSLATISVVSGLKVGIRRLSEICWILGMFIMTVFFFQEDTWYLLNLFSQSLGFYLQWLPSLSFQGDAFPQSPAQAPDGTGADPGFMNAWTIFYWGWWIAWSPFVGMFVAKISRGRTIREFVNGVLSAPVLYSFLWFAIFGGIGLRIERQAANLGIMCALDEADVPFYFQQMTDAVSGAISTTPLDLPMLVNDEGYQIWRLSCRGKNDMWFDMVRAFPSYKMFWILSIISLILYFVTSSDSGSLVIDCLTSNGDPDPPIIQRIFWALTEGAAASALIKAGGTSGLTALQAVSIIAGLPYTVVLCFMCFALWQVMDTEYDKERGVVAIAQTKWRTELLDVADYPTFKLGQFQKTLAAVFVPFYFGGAAASKVNGKPVVTYQIIYGVMMALWISLLIANTWQAGLFAIGWFFYCLMTVHMGIERSAIREAQGISGNTVSDIILSLVLYPFVAIQMYDEAFEGPGLASSPGSGHVSETTV